jgi:hypothetical protein
MRFNTKNGSVGVKLGAYTKSKKAEFNILLDNAGYMGDLSKAWKDYQDASYKASRKKKK